MSTTTIALATITALALITLAFIQTSVPVMAAKPAKVTICHVGFDEDTNSTTFKTLNISAKAVAKHIANHGDTLGVCP